MKGKIVIETETDNFSLPIVSGDQVDMYNKAARLRKEAGIIPGEGYKIYALFPSKMNTSNINDNFFYNQTN